MLINQTSPEASCAEATPICPLPAKVIAIATTAADNLAEIAPAEITCGDSQLIQSTMRSLRLPFGLLKQV